MTEHYGYNLNRTIDEIRPDYRFNETCIGSVPQAIIAFLEGRNCEETIRLAISIGGDSDTIACIAASIAATGKIKKVMIGTFFERIVTVLDCLSVILSFVIFFLLNYFLLLNVCKDDIVNLTMKNMHVVVS